jgi:outer membrane protein assembly factor BamB
MPRSLIPNLKRSVVRRFSFFLLAVAVACAVITAADWPTPGGSPSREGWARAEKILTKDSVGGLNLLYKYQADNKARGLYSLTAPLIDGMLITYRGFKEMLVFSGSSDNVYNIDADLNRLLWKTHFEYKGAERQSKHSTATCPGGLTSSVSMAGSSSAGVSFGRRQAVPVRPGGIMSNQLIGGSGFGSVGAFYVVSSDGYLHTLNPSTGADLIPAVKLVPENSTVSALNVDGNTIYAATSGSCGGHADAIYAVDLGSTDKKVASVPAHGAPGTTIGTDGTVYVQVPYEQGDTDASHHTTILALQPQTLGVKDSFVTENIPNPKKSVQAEGATPLVFAWKGKDLVLASGDNGRLYLLDATSLGGSDHHTPLFATEPIASAAADYAGHGFRGGFSSWTDADGNRWVYASLWGPPQASAKFPVQNGDAANGSIVAFKVTEQNGQPTLSPAWISPNVPGPAPAVTAGGVVFALSTGEPTSLAKAKGKPYSLSEIEKASTHATLFALDAESGKQLYSSAGAVPKPSYGSGLAVANGRIYFAASDNAMYAFGFSKMNPQLTDK